MTVQVKIQILPSGEGLPLPEYQSEGAAGFDLLAAIPNSHPVILEPFTRHLIPTGLSIEIPHGYEGQVRPRSGLALRNGITVLNAPGTVDCDYRGEIGVILINLGSSAFKVTRGARIAQLILAPVARADLLETTQLAATGRGAGGFGSTGTSTVSTGGDTQ